MHHRSGRVTEGEMPARFRFVRWLLAVCIWIPLFAANAQDSKPAYDLQIPQLTVDLALEQLAQQTGTQFLFSYDLVKTLEANPVFGRYTVMDAMDIMLRDTGLSSSETQGGMVTVSQEPSRTGGRRKADHEN